jgi:chaperonin cofactor prefoldin
MATLYEINYMIEHLLESDLTQDDEVIDKSTGEIIRACDLIDQLEMDLNTKLENVGCYIKNLDSDIEALKNEEKTLADRRRVKENQLERLKKYLADNLQVAGMQKFESPRCVLSFRKSEQVVISEGAVIPEEFIIRKVTEQPDKKLLKDAIKQGFEFDGITLVENKNLQIK